MNRREKRKALNEQNRLKNLYQALEDLKKLQKKTLRIELLENTGMTEVTWFKSCIPGEG
jgi:hypothetical protein